MTFVNRWEKNKMITAQKRAQTFADQVLGNCPHKVASNLVALNGQAPSRLCEGPTCQWWLRQEARVDSPGNCAVAISALQTSTVAALANMIAGAAQQALNGIGTLLRLFVKRHKDILVDEFNELIAAEAAEKEKK